MGAASSSHPDDQILQSYGLGKLNHASAQSLSKNLETCSDCQSRVAELSEDTFLDRLRDAQGRAENATAGWAHSSVSQTDRGPSVAISPPSADTMPPGLADHPDYEVIKELGRGGMGVVYLAHNRLMGRNEVLKVMSRHIMERPGLMARFLSEIRAVARLQHPNIVTAYSAVRLGESILFAMEYVDGLDLARLVKTKGPLPVANACYFVNQAALGMQHAHEQGMVHRDIKPGNLMLSHKGQRAVVKVLDFGLAKATREAPVDGGLTNPGQALGTPDYMAPEQIRDAQKADIRADVYSLGCTLYYLLSGGPPFRAENLWDLYQAHHSMDAKQLNFVRPAVPSELAALVAKMMAKEPGRRFQTPAAVAQALTPFFKKVSQSTQVSSAEVSQVGQPTARARRAEIASAPTQPATNLAPAAAPRLKKSSQPARAEPTWESLIEFKETEPLKEAVPRVVAKPRTEKPKWLLPVAAGGTLLLALVLVCAAIVLVVKTRDGNLVLENVPESAIVEVDGAKVTVAPANGERIEVQLKPGQHGVVVKHDDVVLTGESVTIESGKNFKLTVRREAEVVRHPTTSEANAASKPTDSMLSSIVDRTRFNIFGGEWSLNGDELVQTDTMFSELLFGDDRWTDYEFKVDVMRVGGGNSFSLFFRSTARGDQFDYKIAGDGNKTCHAYAREQGRTSALNSYDLSLRDGAWYTARVHVRGNHLVCSIYDNYNSTETRVFDIVDDRHPRGRVGLQTFGSSFRFKNIKVTAPDGKVLWEGLPAIESMKPAEFSKPSDPPAPAAAKEGFVQLFNGVDKTGWKTHPWQPGDWHVENGILVGSGPAALSHLYTIRDDYKDFHLRVEARINDVGNSGVYFRSAFGPSWPSNGAKFPLAYEAQIYSKSGERNYTGSLFAGTNAVVNVNVPPVLPFEWFTLEVVAQGNHVVVRVNGMTTADYADTSRNFTSGHIALQQLDPETIVEFRKVEIKELEPSAQAASMKAQQAAENAEGAPSSSNVGRSNVQKNLVSGQTAKNNAADAFQPGTVWIGKRFLLSEAKSAPQEATATLTVRERQGTSFRARYVLGTAIREVQGTIESGRIGWSAQDVKIIKGSRGLDYSGTIQGTNIVMSFSGTDRNSHKKLWGTVKMRLEK
jgi:serine/threonine protein kinase